MEAHILRFSPPWPSSLIFPLPSNFSLLENFSVFPFSGVLMGQGLKTTIYSSKS